MARTKKAKLRRLSREDRVAVIKTIWGDRQLRQMYDRLFPDPADRMWHLRETMNMSQKALAEECGLSSGAISRIECGYGLPKGTTLQKLGEGVGISANFILGLSDKEDIE